MRSPAERWKGGVGAWRRAAWGSFNAHALSENPIYTDPSVDAATIISNLEAFALNGFDQVQVLEPVDLA